MSAPTEQREQWSGQLGFLLAAIGSAVGLGNIWRFPGVAYENGGGAFLLPYLAALLTAGIPILFLDYSLGHRFRGSAPTVFRRLHPKAEPIGWFQVGASFVIMCYYGVIIGWAISYTVYAATLAWGDDPVGFFVTDHLRVEEPAESFSLSFTVVPGLLIPILLVWVGMLVVVLLGVQKGIEKANYIFMPLLFVVFTILVVRALFLPGAVDGLNAFFTPDFSALTNPAVWLAAYGHIFFSLSIAFGIMITYSSYLKKKSDLTSTGLVAAFSNSSFEVLAGVGVFATLGFMAYTQNMTIPQLGEETPLTGPGLSFMTFPEIISSMPGGVIFGLLFFGCLVAAGFTSIISIAQVVIAAISEKFGLTRTAAAILVVGSSGFFAVVLFATTAGLPTLDVVDKFINEIGVVVGAIAMCLLVTYGVRRLGQQQAYLNRVSGFQVGTWWRAMIAIVVPLVLTVILLVTAVSLIREGYDGLPTWFVLTFGLGAVLAAAISAVVLTALPWRRNVDDFEPDDAGEPAEEVTA